MVRLTGTIIIPTDRQPRLLPLLDEHIRLSRAEPGFLLFEITRDQSEPATFHLDEKFIDAAAFGHHQKRGAVSPWGRASAGLARNFRKTTA